jgi:hypothetical protein
MFELWHRNYLEQFTHLEPLSNRAQSSTVPWNAEEPVGVSRESR